MRPTPYDVKLLCSTTTSPECAFHFAKATSATTYTHVKCHLNTDKLKQGPLRASGEPLIGYLLTNLDVRLSFAT